MKDGFSSLAGSSAPDNSCLACHFANISYRLTCARCGSLTEHGAESCADGDRGHDADRRDANPHYDYFAGLPERLQPRGGTV